MSEPPIIEVDKLSKRFGAIEALRETSFTVAEGEIFGLIGHNGAGKTTCLRILSTLLSPSGGRASVCGFDVAKEPEQVRRVISYLPEEAGAYQHLSGWEFLEFMASFYTQGARERGEMVEEAAAICDLGERLGDSVKTYSKGMLRRILLARTLMVRPRVAILDEPTSGLDVLQSIKIREIIKEYSKQGTTVLLSSHNMLEVEYLCDRVALIYQGRVLVEGAPGELKEKWGKANLEEVFREVSTHG